MCRGAAPRVTPASSATLQPPPRTPGRTQVPGQAGAARRGGGDTRQVAWGPLPYAPELPPPSPWGGGNGPIQAPPGPLVPVPNTGGWGASEPFVRRGTALPGRAGCSAVCLVRRLLLGIAASPPGACCPGVQLTAQGKGPRATSAQGWCLLYPPSRPSCVPVFRTPPPPKGQGSTALLWPPRPVLSLGTRTPARPGPPGRACLLGQVCWTELLWGDEGCAPGRAGFPSTLWACPLLHTQSNVDCLGDKQVTEASMRLD